MLPVPMPNAYVEVTHRRDPNRPSFNAIGYHGLCPFLIGKDTADYQLYVNGRKYDWPKHPAFHLFNSHVRYCIDFDNAFYTD